MALLSGCLEQPEKTLSADLGFFVFTSGVWNDKEYLIL